MGAILNVYLCEIMPSFESPQQRNFGVFEAKIFKIFKMFFNTIKKPCRSPVLLEQTDLTVSVKTY